MMLTKQWQTIPHETVSLKLMLQAGLAWRSYEVVGDVVLARYCLAHDVSGVIVPKGQNDYDI